jgi:general secretion pathway protein A
MRQLAQRITARFHLKPLTRNELKAYITHRLAVAGSNIQLFDEKTIKRLYQLSNGIPRIVNIICDRALLGAYVENKNRVDIQTLNNAAKEVFGEINHSHNTKPRWPAVTAMAATVAALAAAVLLLAQTGLDAPSLPSLALEDQLQENVASNEKSAADNTETVALHMADSEQAAIKQESTVATGQADKPADSHQLPAMSEADMSSDLKELLFTEADTSKVQAYTDLFNIWNKEYDAAINGSACSFALDKGLSCLHRQGNLRSLAILNRPAVLKFYDEHNNTGYAILTYLNNNEATLRKGDETITVSVDILNDYWLGEYTLFWQKPPYYHAAIQPGSQGPIVQWLDQQLVRLYGQKEIPTIRDTYNDELQSQIIKFQQSKGLTPDGVVGPHTFILLNSELEMNTPLLNTRKG